MTFEIDGEKDTMPVEHGTGYAVFRSLCATCRLIKLIFISIPAVLIVSLLGITCVIIRSLLTIVVAILTYAIDGLLEEAKAISDGA